MISSLRKSFPIFYFKGFPPFKISFAAASSVINQVWDGAVFKYDSMAVAFLLPPATVTICSIFSSEEDCKPIFESL